MWYYGFMACGPQKKLLKSRPRMTNEAILNTRGLNTFFDVLESYLNDKLPNLVWNCDESGVPLDFRPQKVVVSIKAKIPLVNQFWRQDQENNHGLQLSKWINDGIHGHI